MSEIRITDTEFKESADNRETMYETELKRLPVQASDNVNRTFMDRLGRGRWPIDYYTARVRGYNHQDAMLVERRAIRAAAGLNQTEPAPAPITPPGPGIPVGPGGRTSDPAPGSRLPLPTYGVEVVKQVAKSFPAYLKNSCQDKGGTWDFMDWVVDTLRTYDSRWGYNGKRGNANDPSMDVVTYHYGAGSDENSTDVYIIDIIGGHCGANPEPIWVDQTQITANAGSIGRWISRGRF